MAPKSPDQALLELREILDRIPLFAALDDAEVVRIGAAARMQRFARDEVVIERGDPPQALYAIADGRLKVVRPRPGARDATLMVLGSGDVFGEVAILSRRREGRSARVSALRDSLLLVIDAAAFARLLKHSRVLPLRLLTLVCDRLRDTIVHLDDVTSLEVPRRFARKLLLLSERFGVQTEGGIGLGIQLSQHELGDLVETSRKDINICLRTWVDEGIVSQRDGHLVILDPEALAAIAAKDG